jgi:hypothetical protein
MIELGLFQAELPSPNDRATRLRVHLDNGDALTEECLSAPGGPDQPFSDEVILKKCAALAGRAYPSFCAYGFLQPDRKDQVRTA